MIKQTAIATGLFLAAGGAFAAQASDSAATTADVAFGQSFAALDSNGNGQVSWSEANAQGISQTAFESAETTQDGMLSMAEYNAAQAARDGVVGEAVEIGEDTVAQAESVYVTMDTNNDDQVSEQEFNAYYQQAGVYDRWDVNDDGRIGQQEFVEVLYIYYDDNDDGYIDDAEWEDALMVDDYGDNGFWDV